MSFRLDIENVKFYMPGTVPGPLVLWFSKFNESIGNKSVNENHINTSWTGGTKKLDLITANMVFIR